MTFTEVSRLIRRMVAINLANSMAYRGDFIFYMLGVVLGPVISVLIWRAAIASGAELPVDSTYLTTYFVLLAVVSMLTSAWLRRSTWRTRSGRASSRFGWRGRARSCTRWWPTTSPRRHSSSSAWRR